MPLLNTRRGVFSQPAVPGNPGFTPRCTVANNTGMKRLILTSAAFLAGLLSSGAAQSEAAFGDRVRNVLFLISDDLKASALGCYGDSSVKTPHIDALAKQGMVFERAYCQGTSCGPSRTSFMHSRYRGGAALNLGLHFRNNGWHTARVGKIYHMRVPGDIIAGTHGADIANSWTERHNSTGLEAHTPGDYACLNLNIFTSLLEGRQSTRMPHRPFVTVRYAGDGSDQPDHKTATKTMALLRQNKNRRFFIAAGFVRPHYPMVAPNQYFDAYPWERLPLPDAKPDDLADIPKAGRAGSNSKSTGLEKYPDNQKRMWAGYYATIQFMDEQVGRVLAELDRLGLRDSTAVVFTSDHGYHLGEHGFWQKSNLHEEVLRVPLIVSVPGMKPGRSQSLVELTDLFPTLASSVGLKIPDSVQGKDLSPILADPRAEVRRAALSVGGKGYALRGADWAYIRYHDDSEELYDMRRDPNQFDNLAGRSEQNGRIRELRAQLDARLEASGLAWPRNGANRSRGKTRGK